MEQYRGTTILSVRRGNKVVIGGDGQVSLGNMVMKGNARKVRRLYNDKVIAGFAGGTADAFTLFERFEGKLEKHQGNLVRAAVELADSGDRWATPSPTRSRSPSGSRPVRSRSWSWSSCFPGGEGLTTRTPLLPMVRKTDACSITT